ncbi:MAG: hypothetical protein R3F33_10410 [Planctomycetota bacterium]
MKRAFWRQRHPGRAAIPAGLLAWMGLLAGVAGAQDGDTVLERPEVRYHLQDEVRGLLDGWQEAAGPGVRSFDVAPGVPAIEIGSEVLAAGPDRRLLIVIGGLDGRSVAGGEAALQAAWRILRDRARLRPDLAVLVIPWADPEQLAHVDLGLVASGRDLDGDGLVLEMLVEDRLGPWTPSEDARFLVLAKNGQGPRYRRLVEGQIEGRESTLARIERCFPAIGQEPDWRPKAAEPLALALRQLFRTRSVAGVLVFGGNHGGIAYPGAGPQGGQDELADLASYERMARALAGCTGRTEVAAQPLAAVREIPMEGSFIDWCYQSAGVLAVEVAPWGPPLGDEPEAEANAAAGDDPWRVRPALDGPAARWARWLDDQQGGMGYAEWRPIERSDVPACLVGGWQPKTYYNPPEGELEGALRGLDEFVWQWVEQQAALELCDVRVQREGDLCLVSARLRCSGGLPPQAVGLGDLPGGPWLRLALPGQVERLAGPSRPDLSGLGPGSKSRAVTWLLHAPPGTRITVEFGCGTAKLGSKEWVL